MLDEPEFLRWRAAAENARQSSALQADGELFNWSCFLAEQSAQLALEGLLHGVGAGAWGHDLVKLGRALGQATDGMMPAEVAAALRRLSRHYIPAHYPDAHPSGSPDMHYGREDAEGAREDLDVVLANVDALWADLSAAAQEDRHGR